jgi:hypothetical protein
MKLDLARILNQIPRDNDGTPRFANYTQLRQTCNEDEILELVNRSVYNLDYQRIAHKKYHEQKNALERPIRDAFKTLFPNKSFAKATNEEIVSTLRFMKGGASIK